MIYLDNAATTPLDPEVLDAMLPWLRDGYGNPSSIHAPGRRARAALDEARDQAARVLHCDYSEITFTSGGTEADNLAIFGAMRAAKAPGGALVVSPIEHAAVRSAAAELRERGTVVRTLPVDADGLVPVAAVREAAAAGPTSLVSVMHANNEIGTIQDIARIARAAHDAGALCHTDAVQTFGALPIDVRGLGCDLLSVSAHKIHGPKGIGALFIRSGTPVAPMLFGGSQERARRPGTENVAGIVGFGCAAGIAARLRDAEADRLTGLRGLMVDALVRALPDARINGTLRARLPGNVNVSAPGADGAAAVLALDRGGIAASSGAACSSGSIEPSHVLRAIGLSDDLAASGVRFTLGRATTEADIHEAVRAYAAIVHRLREP